MKCKNYELMVKGARYDDETRKVTFMKLCAICSNDEFGKTLSIDDGRIQFSLNFEHLAKIFEGDYKDEKIKCN